MLDNPLPLSEPGKYSIKFDLEEGWKPSDRT